MRWSLVNRGSLVALVGASTQNSEGVSPVNST